MNRFFTLLLGWLCATASLPAQVQFDFADLETRPCAFNPDVNVVQPTNWLFYQTLNDEWDGPIDSSRCISGEWFVPTSGAPRFRILASEMDTSRALFGRLLAPADDARRALLPEWVYFINYPFTVNWPNSYRSDSDCPGGICSGLILQLAAPTSTGDTLIRTTQALANDVGGQCFATEDIAETRWQEIVLKVTLSLPLTNPAEAAIRFYPLTLESFDELSFNLLDGLEFPTPTGSGATVSSNLYEAARPDDNFPWRFTWVANRPGTTLPDDTELRYIEAYPDSPVDRQLELNLFLDEETLLFQPYTALRGALVAGSDTLRHQLNVFFGSFAQYCGYIIIELVGDYGTQFHFSTGHVGFANPTSCFMLANNSAIQVEPGEQLVYGQDGVGMLGLFNRGWLKLTAGSTLELHNRVMLLGQGPRQHGYVDLQPGSRLVFGEGASLERQVETSGMTLEVLMHGGELDDSRLPPHQRALIERIYPQPPAVQPGQALVYPNPTRGYIRFALTDTPAGPLQWQLLDALGRPVAQGRTDWEPLAGYALLSPAATLPTGWYTLSIGSASGQAIGKVFWLQE